MGFPGRGKGVEKSSHEVKTDEVNLTVLLPSVHILLYLEPLILLQFKYKPSSESQFTNPSFRAERVVELKQRGG